MKEGWLWDSILKTAARPSPMSTAPAFSPGPLHHARALGGQRLAGGCLLLLYEQCSDHMTEKRPSSVRLGSRPRAFDDPLVLLGREVVLREEVRGWRAWRPLFYAAGHRVARASTQLPREPILRSKPRLNLHRPRHPRLLPADRGSSSLGPRAGEGLLPAERLGQRPLLRHPRAGPRGLPEDRALRRLPLPVRALPALRRSRGVGLRPGSPASWAWTSSTTGSTA